jgi:hypothetical protein
MYVMPLTLDFHGRWPLLFHDVHQRFGAFLAITMPNYSDSILIFDPRIFQFYNNHIYAFMMPVLVILLGCFERPKWKYFGYSMIGFRALLPFCRRSEYLLQRIHPRGWQSGGPQCDGFLLHQ